MSGITGQENPADPHMVHASLMHSEPRHGLDLVLVRLRMTGQDRSKFLRQPFFELLFREPGVLAVSYTPQTVFRDSHRNEPVVGMEGPLQVGPAILV